MFDPLPLRNPPWLQEQARYFADLTGMKSLPPHIHEVLIAFMIYQFTLSYISPILSQVFFKESFAKLSPKTQFNWHVHAVALLQSVLVCGLALYVVAYDNERALMTTWQERIFGYTGGLGMVQAFGAGYFVWDLYICVRYYSLYGFGMLAHAIGALTVYSLGFRPFVNFYSTSFILYEISSPFLNIHWFCDKLEMTGSTIQLVNGVILLITFAGARLVYGGYITYSLIKDILAAVKFASEHPALPPLATSPFLLNTTTLFNNPKEAFEVVKYAPLTAAIPTWIWASNIASAVMMNLLNWYWYNQMISAIRKRFDPPFGTRKKEKADLDVKVSRGTDEKGRKTLEVDATELKRRAPVRLQSDMPPPA